MGFIPPLQPRPLQGELERPCILGMGYSYHFYSVDSGFLKYMP